MIRAYNSEYNQIMQEIYIAAFPDKDFPDITLDEIKKSVESELGTIARISRELIAQSFGNYYYGKEKSRIANAIVQFFKESLK